MEHLLSINEFWGDLSKFVGKVSGGLSNSMDKPRTSNPPKFIQNLRLKKYSDEDLALEILEFINKLPKDYDKSGEFKLDHVNKSKEDSYFFVGRPFKRDESLYRVNIVKHLDFRNKTEYNKHKIDTEYTVSISSVKDDIEKTSDGSKKSYGGLGTGIRLSGELKIKKDNDEQSSLSNKVNRDANKIFGESEVLKCHQKTALKIFNSAESIYKSVAKTTKGDARGGQNRNV